MIGLLGIKGPTPHFAPQIQNVVAMRGDTEPESVRGFVSMQWDVWMGIRILIVSSPSLSDCLTGNRVDNGRVWAEGLRECQQHAMPNKTGPCFNLKKGPADLERHTTKQRGGVKLRASLTAVLGSINNLKPCVLIAAEAVKCSDAVFIRHASHPVCVFIDTPCLTVCLTELKSPTPPPPPRSHLIHMHTMNNAVRCGKYWP